jgi:hypothetical protein
MQLFVRVARSAGFSQAARELGQGRSPFDVIGDPGKTLYRRYGVERSISALLAPKAFAASLKGSLMKRRPAEWWSRGLPADFLIAADGSVKAVHYGGTHRLIEGGRLKSSPRHLSRRTERDRTDSAKRHVGPTASQTPSLRSAVSTAKQLDQYAPDRGRGGR